MDVPRCGGPPSARRVRRDTARLPCASTRPARSRRRPHAHAGGSGAGAEARGAVACTSDRTQAPSGPGAESPARSPGAGPGLSPGARAVFWRAAAHPTYPRAMTPPSAKALRWLLERPSPRAPSPPRSGRRGDHHRDADRRPAARRRVGVLTPPGRAGRQHKPRGGRVPARRGDPRHHPAARLGHSRRPGSTTPIRRATSTSSPADRSASSGPARRRARSLRPRRTG